MTDERWNGFLERLEPYRSGKTTGATEYFPDVQKRRGNEAEIAALTYDHHANIRILNDLCTALINDAANRRRDVIELQEESETRRLYNERLKVLLWVSISLFVGGGLLFLFFLLLGA